MRLPLGISLLQIDILMQLDQRNMTMIIIVIIILRVIIQDIYQYISGFLTEVSATNNEAWVKRIFDPNRVVFVK